MISFEDALGEAQQHSHDVKPDPTDRFCSFCEHRREFNDDWTCTSCGNRSVFFVEFDDCPDCNVRRMTRFVRNRKTVHCACGLSDKEREKQVKTEVEIQREHAERRRRELKERAYKLQQLRKTPSRIDPAVEYENYEEEAS